MDYTEISSFLHCYKSLKWYDIFGKQFEECINNFKKLSLTDSPLILLLRDCLCDMRCADREV